MRETLKNDVLWPPTYYRDLSQDWCDIHRETKRYHLPLVDEKKIALKKNHCVTFFALAFFSYASESGFFLACVVVLAKRSSNSLALTIFSSSKMFHSVLLLQER